MLNYGRGTKTNSLINLLLYLDFRQHFFLPSKKRCTVCFLQNFALHAFETLLQNQYKTNYAAREKRRHEFAAAVSLTIYMIGVVVVCFQRIKCRAQLIRY